ncbi:MarR family transcriptional regulator [Alicyclobacillus sp.]|uniref:MarR family winged helix-turn-helix transcriptional regulator n=1 Tax=Alicyclobacillus sp. TaxID=61169 RepID=UPI0025C5D0F4|nr:MarR family transcriptional regulator [Alicyclobacillus sp.]MCL6516585.1 MarR family transcriptional regulator [Alicyclobacillus sp.]
MFAHQVAEIEHHLRQIAGVIRRRGRMLLEQYQITPPQFDALLILDRSGDLTIGDLSSRLYLAYSTTTDLVDRLERSGFVVRERDQADRRVVRVRLLQKGADIIERVLDARRAYLAGVLESLNHSERSEILRVLELLNGKISGD